MQYVGSHFHILMDHADAWVEINGRTDTHIHVHREYINIVGLLEAVLQKFIKTSVNTK